ncbi:hypothetical protein [Micromonospora avicenniae]|uniref:Uncharacterized protein n=1 Tax=Micromonospora avicenniae TaxID=1198245 RepID=A0A1N7F4R1_9ACTN|nr:hypothetical protein [Micromonospora avicenniae]SIR95215.1 hypothetical protein SAMN05444858_13033 [Micromonospora avicenniae]
MFGLDGSYVMYVAFFYGYREGVGDDLLAKLKEKLVGDLGTGQNLGWESLLLRKVAPNDPELWRPLAPREESFDRRLCEALFDQLEDLLGDA